MSIRLIPILSCVLSFAALFAQDPPPWPILVTATDSASLPGTTALNETGDLSRLLHDANDRSFLICPRPFMVERGHFDGVGPDEQVAFEFAKVRNLYEAKLGLTDRCEIE